MSRQSTFSNIIHLRDFVDAIAADPTRENAPNYVEIQIDLNIFGEDGFYSPNITVESIPTRIHAYLTQEERELYYSDTSVYAIGRFSAAPSADGTPQINVQALSLMRHPGGVADFDEYRRHLPQQWCPMVTVIGSVPSRDENSTDSSEHRHFTVETSVYDVSKATTVQFSVFCFLENTKRWQKVKTPQSGAFLSITGKLAGCTTNTNHLALRVLDLAYLPRPSSAVATPSSATMPSSKRSRRWDGRAPSSTPSKKSRTSKPIDGVAAPAGRNTAPPGPTTSGISLPATGDAAKSPSVPPSPSTATNIEDSSLDSIPPLNSDVTRPHRNRHPPRKYAEMD